MRASTKLVGIRRAPGRMEVLRCGGITVHQLRAGSNRAPVSPQSPPAPINHRQGQRQRAAHGGSSAWRVPWGHASVAADHGWHALARAPISRPQAATAHAGPAAQQRRRMPTCGTARNGVITPAAGSRAHMFKHRRVRVTWVLLISWITLAAVERWAEQSPWPSATMNGLLWSCVVAGTWWFAEITQRRPPAATARETGKSAPSSEPKETAVSAPSSLSPAESSEATMDR